MEYTWIKTTAEVYRAIFNEHKDLFVVFESYTNNDEETDSLKGQITAWGFKDANHPVIKSKMNNFTDWEYYLIHQVTED